ncbi:MAG: type II secretion system F family protein [bacterium]
MTPMMTLSFVVLVFGAVFLVVWAVYPRRFIAATQAQMQSQGDNAIRSAGQVVLGRVGSINRPLVSVGFARKMARRFVAMGRPRLLPEEFIAMQELGAILFGVLGLLLLNALKGPLIAAIFFTLFGVLFPYIWISDQIKKRHHKINRALPYAIDLLTLSVEAGLDFQAAIGTVVEKGKPGPLMEEFGIMLGEIKLGKTREESLRNLADRVQLAVLTAFVTNLIQADRMGTSLGRILRIQSTQMRIDRTQRAEKLANEAPVKMLLPLVACFFPTVFMILFGPIVFRLMYGGQF